MGRALTSWPINRSLGLLVGAQGATALLGLVTGKLIALYLSPDAVGNYNLGYVSLMLANTVLITPTLKSMRALLPIAPTDAVLRFHLRVMLLVYAGLLTGITVWGVLTANSLLAALAGLALVGQGFYALGLEYMNALAHHRAFSRTQVLYSFVNALLIILLVVSNHRQQTGLWVVLALLNGGFAVAMLMGLSPLRAAFRRNADANSISYWNPFWAYVRPLLGSAVCAWVINYVDRYFIERYGSSADVGYYSVGYSLGSKIVLLSMPVQAYLTPLVMQLKGGGQKPSSANPLLLRVFWLYVLVVGVICLLFFNLSAEVGTLVLSKSYEPAFRIAPVIAFAYLGMTARYILEVKLYAFSITRPIFSCYLVGAIVNVLLNCGLTPAYGIWGAALATCLSAFCQSGLTLYVFLKTE